MQLVLLAGELGEKYGQRHEYYGLNTPADAIKLLCINYPQLREDLMVAHHNGVAYKVIQGGAAMAYEELQLPFGSKPLLVVPVITGSGGGAGTQILLGVGLVAASILAAPLGAGFLGLGAGFGATVGPLAATGGALVAGTGGVIGAGLSTAIGAIGASLILGGTAQLLAPQPTLPKGDRIKGSGTNVRGPGPDGITRGASGNQSYAFTGPANTAGSGATLPVIYGRVTTGSHLIAAAVDVVDNSDPLQIATQQPGVSTVKINSEELTRTLKDCGGIEARREGGDLIKGSGNERCFVNQVFGPSGDKPLKAESVINYTHGANENTALEYSNKPKKRGRMDVIFKVRKGLYDFINKKGTTKIDGFIVAEVTITISRGGSDVDVAKARFTLQGLTNANGHDFSFGVRLEGPDVKGRSGDGIDVKVEIIEVGCHDECTLDFVGYGYDIL